MAHIQHDMNWLKPTAGILPLTFKRAACNAPTWNQERGFRRPRNTQNSERLGGLGAFLRLDLATTWCFVPLRLQV